MCLSNGEEGALLSVICNHKYTLFLYCLECVAAFYFYYARVKVESFITEGEN